MNSFFYIDGLSKVVISLIIFIAIIVAIFAKSYLKGDSKYRNFFLMLLAIVVSMIVALSADNIFLFLSFWLLSNALLVKMMIHKKHWKPAFASGKMAGKNFFIGFCSLAVGFTLLYLQTNQTSMHAIASFEYSDQKLLTVSLIFILIGAMTQSAIYPFNSWLINSLNSPTPVSAIMHAGLVNGGAILLARFAPLYLSSPKLLTIIFIIGITTALIGTFWKLIQSNVKAMLACSTMGQMGFMLAQCGLGLFSVAIAHLFWHGCFKSYLFLTSGSASQEKKLDLNYPPSLVSFALALVCGAFGIFNFSVITDKHLFVLDTNIVLYILAFIAGTHFALNLLREKPIKNLLMAIALTSISGVLYGLSIHLIESQLSLSDLNQPQRLNVFHILAIIIFILLWLGRLFYHNPNHKMANLMARFYVTALNASQPVQNTITANRNKYKS